MIWRRKHSPESWNLEAVVYSGMLLGAGKPPETRTTLRETRWGCKLCLPGRLPGPALASVLPTGGRTGREWDSIVNTETLGWHTLAPGFATSGGSGHCAGEAHGAFGVRIHLSWVQEGRGGIWGMGGAMAGGHPRFQPFWRCGMEGKWWFWGIGSDRGDGGWWSKHGGTDPLQRCWAPASSAKPGLNSLVSRKNDGSGGLW